MSKKNSNNSSELRNQAEARLKKRFDKLDDLHDSDPQRLIHELRVHQIELEMQNEELRKSQTELEESRAGYSDLYDFAPVGYFTFDKNGLIIEVNLTGAGQLGVQRNLLIKKPFSGFIHKDDQNVFFLHRGTVFEARELQTCELRLRRKNGAEFYTQLQSIAVEEKSGNAVYCMTAVSDISESKRAEQALREINETLEQRVAERTGALRESEERYRSIFEGANDGIIAAEITTGEFLFVNKRMSDLTGYSEQEILRLGIKDLHPPEDLPHVLEQFNKQAAGEITKTTALPVLRKDKSIIYCDIGSSFLGKTILIGFFRDVTERKRAEDKIIRAKEQWELTFASVPDMIAIIDNNHRVVRVNDSMAKRLGRQSEECVGLPCYEAVHGTTVPPAFCPHSRTVKDGREHVQDIHEERLGMDLQVTTTPLFDEQGHVTGSVHVAHDLTGRKKAEWERETTVEFLRLVNESRGTGDLIQAATAFFQERSGCDAIGIRLNKEGDYPYFETRGFPREFVEMENSLCSCDIDGKPVLDNAGNPVLACMCGNVICGRSDPSKPFFTARGSFWSNCTTELLASTTEADRQARTRNKCNGEGYESVALIALRSGGENLGLLQLNDKRRGRFTPETIALWERLVDYLAVALAKFRSEEALQKAKDELEFRVQERTAALARLTRLYSTLSKVNEAIVRIHEPLKLYEEVCRITVEEGAFRLAWIGLLDRDTRNVIPVASYGETAYLSGIRIIALDVPEGKGPTGRAVVEQRHFICSDIESDPIMLPWRDAALSHGIRSSSSFPIRSGPEVVGAFTIYSDEPSYFTEEEINLLLSLTEDISFAIKSIENEKKRHEVEEALRRSHEKLEGKVEKRTAELVRSNTELEQFAYIAAHDLQEPLRMITSYLEIIDKRYRDKLDKDAGEFIDYSLSGAVHMKALLNGLLEYSRVGTKGKPFELIDLNISLKKAIANLKKQIEESGAQIIPGNLPGVYADETQMVQLFQNLIGNAIKFRGDKAPVIKVSAGWKETEWEIRVIDNGIGIDPKFFDKIFLIFKRLHSKEKYPGTGIGLAICKKIVERHGSRIWVESEAGKGTAFYFTLPMKRQ